MAKAKPAPRAAANPGKRRSRIDFDEEVDAARKVAKEAKKVLKSKIAQAKMAERKKIRIVAKASKLPSDDLLRIALYKRINIVKTAMSADVQGSLQAVMNNMDISQLQHFLTSEIERRQAAAAPAAAAEPGEASGANATAAASSVQHCHGEPQPESEAVVEPSSAMEVEPPAAGPAEDVTDGQVSPASAAEAEGLNEQESQL